MDRAALIARIARTWALNAAAHARVLASQDPSWGTEVFELAGGHAVLCGHGLYVNRALAMGLDGPVTTDDFDRLEARSAVVGVAPSIDVVPTAERSLSELAGARGYGIQRFLTTHLRTLDDATGVAPGEAIDRHRAGRRRPARRLEGRRRRGLRSGRGRRPAGE